jgi:putative ABC transport system substrate-binding protein
MAGMMKDPLLACAQLKDLEVAARVLGLQLYVLDASTEADIDSAFAALVQLRIGALVISIDTFFIARSKQLATLTVRNAVPVIFEGRAFVEAGGLIGYGSDIPDVYRQAGIYAGRILKGEKPADLPVVQSTRIELLINLKTAKALGVTMPDKLLATADEVIE